MSHSKYLADLSQASTASSATLLAHPGNHRPIPLHTGSAAKSHCASVKTVDSGSRSKSTMNRSERHPARINWARRTGTRARSRHHRRALTDEWPPYQWRERGVYGHR
ncbi:hypothetical protein BDZ89DRAFT_838868 [Hymenopellis radicata]|nr:hypothetical protein BDZ89DRAFT_838868 [Hymenopellis radicata]